MDNRAAPGPVVFSLPLLLNILVRRWRLVALCTALGVIAGIAYGIIVKPLYLSTAQIRPGIVAYTPDGGPLRGWAREDIINYFESSLFWDDMRTDPRLEHLPGPPVIDAHYVPSAMQFMAGGDVITLNNLSTNPQEAIDVLDVAMDAFNRMGRRDTLGGDLSLTVRGIEITMGRLRADIGMMGAKEERTKLEIAELEREIGVVDYEDNKLKLDLGMINEYNDWRRRSIASLEAEIKASGRRLEQAEAMLAMSLDTENQTGGGLGDSEGSDAVDTVLRQAASREQAGRVGELLVRVNDLSLAIHTNRVKADSLVVQISVSENDMKRLRMMGEVVLAKNREDIKHSIADKNIVLARDLPNEKSQLEAELRSEQVKLNMITPLELVGRTSATDKPVRPRKPRALSILTILALFGGIGLALTIEYIEANRQTIFKARRD
jgi:capsular polysaccharide biosynthesis protein